MHPRWRSLRTSVALATLAAGVAVVAETGLAAGGPARAVSLATCKTRPWLSTSYQSHSTPEALASLVLSCMKLRFPKTYRHDEVGLVALNSYPWFQNVNEFGLTSTVQVQLAELGMPPITLEDGPGGLITKATPSPALLPNDLALGATFNPSLASLYGKVLGSQAHAMGYDGVQAPALNLLRVPTWGRAAESFGESPVLVGEMGAAEAVAIEAQHEIPVLKHFGPYSQDTNRRYLNQVVSDKAFQELYTRPFTFALRALLPQLDKGGHAVGVMCSYGNVNTLKACRSPLLQDELDYVGVDALIRSDLDVEVNPSALVLNGVDLVKPMDSNELTAALSNTSVDRAVDQSVLQIFETEFADGLVNGATAARPHELPEWLSRQGAAESLQIEEHAAVLLKDADGVLPLSGADRRIAVVSDGTLPNTCNSLAGELGHVLKAVATCTVDSRVSLPHTNLFPHLPGNHAWVTRTTRYHVAASGPYELGVTTYGNTKVRVGGKVALSTMGLAEYAVQRSALVYLKSGSVTVTVTFRGAPPQVVMTPLEAEVRAATRGVHGAKLAIVLAYDLPREGMDRDSLQLPNGQDAVIEAIAAKVPTVVMLGTDGAVTMPWLNAVKGVMVVWNPNWLIGLDKAFVRFVPAWVKVLDGAVDPSGRLPETFPATQAQSPAGVPGFWPGDGSTVDLDLPPDQGVGVGMAWYRAEGWPVLFPFGFGLSYTTYALQGGTLQSDGDGLTMTVGVTDTGEDGGEMPVEVYADWPNAAGEPRQQLVGFAVASFTKQQADDGAVVDVTVPLSPDAFTVDTGGSMRLMSGNYCLEAATYDGDPHALSTGTVALAANAKDTQLTLANPVTLSSSTCPQ